MKTMKSIIVATALGLCSLTFASASANTYNIRLAEPTKAGNAQLAAGTYKLNINGQIATFTNVDTNKSVMVMVRPGFGSRTFERTTVELKEQNGVDRLESIELEDSSSTLEF
jgi:hypothetical protein